MRTQFEKAVAFSGGYIHLRRYANLQNLPHWHREHELVLAESGVVTVMADGNLFTLNKGESVFLHSEGLHSIRAETGSVVAVVKIDAEHFRRLLGDKRLQSPLLSKNIDVAGTVGALLEEQRRNDAYSGRATDSIMTGLLIAILREHSLTEDTPENDTTENYKALLDRIARDHAYITFDEAARSMHFSRPYFSKYFYNHAGMTFTRYLNTIRISVAVERLLQGHATVTDVSQSCGFNTIRNFNRVFKEMTGYTPGTLPRDYSFTGNLHKRDEIGFDPTLGCTVVLT